MSTKINGMPVVPGIIPSPINAAATALHDVGRFSITHGRWFDAIQASFIRFVGKYLPYFLELIFYKDAMSA